MIRKLRRKIFAVIMGILSVILLGILLLFGISSENAYRRRVTDNSARIAAFMTSPQPKDGADSTADKNRFGGLPDLAQGGRDLHIQTFPFWAFEFDEDGGVLRSVSGNTESDESDVQLAAARELAANGAEKGIYDGYAYCVEKTENGVLTVLTDCSSEQEQQRRLTVTLVLTGIGGLAVFGALSFFLSRSIAAPVQEAFEKQKRFISDASHELKTPLTVINANADMLTREAKDSKYLGYIKAEALKMSHLVNDLLTLARLENTTDTAVCAGVDLSRAVESAVMPFECVAFEGQQSLRTEIDPGITCAGDENRLRQLVGILTDNALQHTSANGTVTVRLRREHEHPLLTVSNTGEAIPSAEREKIFERFYRSDFSRSRSENHYGLGLAIAKSIVTQHRGRIGVECADGVTSFWVRL